MQARGADPATVHRLAGFEILRQPEPCAEADAVRLLERYFTFDRLDLDEMNSKAPTPSGADDEIMDAISRARIDGMPVVRTERTIDKGEPFYQLHYPFSETDFPGGPRTLCLALTLRMQQLAGMPAPDDERDGPTEEASTRRPSTRWPHPSRSSNRRNRCTDRAHRADRRTRRGTRPPRTEPQASH